MPVRIAPSPRCSRVCERLAFCSSSRISLRRDDDVAALLVQLDDADFNLLAEIAVEIADGTNLKLRTGQKGLHADVDREAALDAADDRAHHRGLVVGSLLDRVPHAEALRLLVADEIAAFGLLALDHHVDLRRRAGTSRRRCGRAPARSEPGPRTSGPRRRRDACQSA